MHSITKYVAGHSDVLGRHPEHRRRGTWPERLRQVRTRTGGVLAPLDSYLALRGLKTMELRVRRQFENAGRIARGPSGT